MHTCKSDQRGPDCEIFIEVGPGRCVHRGTCRRQALRHTPSRERAHSVVTEPRIQAHEGGLCSLQPPGSAHVGPAWGPVLLALGVSTWASPAPVQDSRLVQREPARQALASAAGTPAVGPGARGPSSQAQGCWGLLSRRTQMDSRAETYFRRGLGRQEEPRGAPQPTRG